MKKQKCGFRQKLGIVLAAGMTMNPLTHQEVQEAADMAAPHFKKLVTESVKAMGAL